MGSLDDTDGNIVSASQSLREPIKMLLSSVDQTRNVQIQLVLLFRPWITLAMNPCDDAAQHAGLTDSGSADLLAVYMDLECEHDVLSDVSRLMFRKRTCPARLFCQIKAYGMN